MTQGRVTRIYKVLEINTQMVYDIMLYSRLNYTFRFSNGDFLNSSCLKMRDKLSQSRGAQIRASAPLCWEESAKGGCGTLDISLGRCSRHIPLGGGPEVDPGQAKYSRLCLLADLGLPRSEFEYECLHLTFQLHRYRLVGDCCWSGNHSYMLSAWINYSQTVVELHGSTWTWVRRRCWETRRTSRPKENSHGH